MDDFLEIHTSDRIAFKRCRRKWDFRSPLRRHLVPDPPQEIIQLWFGTGIHFALEDYFGYNRFGHPSAALEAYLEAFRSSELPEGAVEEIAKGIGMMDYFVKWYTNWNRNNTYATLVVDGVPQVEVDFRLKLTELDGMFDKSVVYQGTFDRIVIDCYGRYWIGEYKTAATIDIDKLMTDPQVKAYAWAAEQWYNHEFEGVLYMQLAKNVPEYPRILTNGTISVNKSQKTTHGLARELMLQEYPGGNFPEKYVELLNHLAEQETPEGNRFIRVDEVFTNTYSKVSTYNHIIAEAKEMLDPNVALYPNPTRDCKWDCKEMRTLCIAMDEGSDWEYLIDQYYKPKGDERHEWRKRINWPKENK